LREAFAGKVVAAVLLLGFLLLAAWWLGAGVVRLVPSSYRSDAVLRLSGGVGDRWQAVSAAGHDDRIAAYARWSGVRVEPLGSTGLVQVSVAGMSAAESRGKLLELLQARQSSAARGGVAAELIYAAPPVARGPEVTPTLRLTLGLAGLASVGLLLAVPLLRLLESPAAVLGGCLAAAVRAAGRINGIAQACAGAGFPPGDGCLPAVRPAG
jgi:hypothetical protein